VNEDELNAELDRLRDENADLREAAREWETKFDALHFALDDIDTIVRKVL
jgi:hypothetical protein